MFPWLPLDYRDAASKCKVEADLADSSENDHQEEEHSYDVEGGNVEEDSVIAFVHGRAPCVAWSFPPLHVLHPI